jgi:hypothetical protein
MASMIDEIESTRSSSGTRMPERCRFLSGMESATLSVGDFRGWFNRQPFTD